MELSDLARRGFGSGADTYHRARPEYRPEPLGHLRDELGLAAGVRVLDLAAGTGRMTRHLVALGADVTAVEPSEAMRETFTRVLPAVPVVDGTGEEIPFPDESFDAVVVAQAFHWFDGPRALREIARVLRRAGGLALIWNERTESDAFSAEISAVTDWTNRQPYDVGRDFRTDLDASGHFSPAQRRQFFWDDRLTHDELVERVGTFSYINAMPAPERTRLFTRLRTHLSTRPNPLDVPYVTDTFTARKHARPES